MSLRRGALRNRDEAQALRGRHHVAVLLEEHLEARGHFVGVGRGHGDALRVDGLQPVQQARALRRRGLAGGLGHLRDQIFVELATLVEGQRRPEHRHDVRALFRQLFGHGQHARDGFFVAFDRHPARQPDAVADEAHALRIEALRVWRNRVVQRRKDQAQRRLGGLCGGWGQRGNCGRDTANLQEFAPRADGAHARSIRPWR